MHAAICCIRVDSECSGVPDKTCTHSTQESHSGIRCLGIHEVLIAILVELPREKHCGAGCHYRSRRMHDGHHGKRGQRGQHSIRIAKNQPCGIEQLSVVAQKSLSSCLQYESFLLI